MKDLNATLLREKFIIRDAIAKTGDAATPVIAMSNRMDFSLTNRDGDITEHFVVRAQNMHSCVRMVARIMQEFHENGPLLTRTQGFDWGFAWDSITRGYEDRFNAQRWVAVYQRGHILYQEGPGERHPFLDIIEQCEARNKGTYEQAVAVAEDAFKQAGKLVTIEHDSNIALVLNHTARESRCGIIARGPNRTTTFNFTAKPRPGRDIRPSQSLSIAAAFLEGIQLAFQIGVIRQKEDYELIEPGSIESQRGHEASQKIGRLNSAIQKFEDMAEVFYRPERPDFGSMIDDAVAFAKTTLASEVERRLSTGELDRGDWVT